MKFRPCIDLHAGKVKQIVGSTLTGTASELRTHFESERPAAEYAARFGRDGLRGGHVIMLGEGCEEACLSALRAFPGGLQVGGGVTPANAQRFLDAGASHVIVTSYVFTDDGELDEEKLRSMAAAVGGRRRLVLDLSCRQRDGAFWVVTQRWQRFSRLQLTAETVRKLSEHCDEFLVHGVDVEGRRLGIEQDLVRLLGAASPVPVTYAGGIRSLADLELVRELGVGRVDATIGSALDLYGGDLPYAEVLAWHNRQQQQQPAAGEK